MKLTIVFVVVVGDVADLAGPAALEHDAVHKSIIQGIKLFSTIIGDMGVLGRQRK